MNIADFQSNIEKLFPVKRENSDFRVDLRNILREYKKLFGSVDKEIQKQVGDWNELDVRIDKLITGIRNCVNSYYARAHSTAYITLLNQMVGISTISGILTSIDLHTIEAGEYLWRGRMFKKNRGRTHKDMFHIPFEKRGIVKTQRYSAPGYPCLYLGTTIYSCWEELGRPKFDDLMISGFKANKSINLLNLCRPKAEDYNQDKLRHLLLRLPLILACSFMVEEKDEEADFKPEYIIPQMLLEVIININNKERRKRKSKSIEELTLGIIYTSTQINNDFGYPAELFENIAIPAINVSNSDGHCCELADCFTVTTPTCNEYEKLKENIIDVFIPCSYIDSSAYEKSTMGSLEKAIKNLELHKIPYLYIDTDKIIIPQDGYPVKLNIESNTEWSVT